MGSDRNHFEDFTISGYWWLPGQQQNAVAGTLTFDNDREIKLEVQGNLAQAPAFGAAIRHQPNIIYGCSSKDERYTLLTNLRTSHVMNAPGYELSTYITKLLLIGEHAGPIDAPQLCDLSVRFPGLEYSTALTWFSKSDPDPSFLQLTWTSPKKFNIWIPAIQAHLRTHFDVSGQGMPLFGSSTHLTANHKAYLQFVPRRKVSLEWAWQKILRIQHLLTLLYGFPTCPLEVKVKLNDGNNISVFFVQNKDGVSRSPVISDFLVPLLSLTRRQREQFFRAWFKARMPFRAAAELLCGTLFQHGIYTRVEFVNHVQTLEAFHRAVYRNSGYYMKPDHYKPIGDAIIATIPTTISSPHKDRLKNIIGYGYEKAQSKRIEELVDSLAQPVRDFLTQSPKPFVRKLVDTRNRYTHYDPHDKKVIFDDHEIAVCNHGLRLFLLFLFLRYLKIPGPTIFRGIQRLEAWRAYSQLRTW